MIQNKFTNILVPVNFNRYTGLAVDKAIQLANKFNCDLHLLHVQKPAFIIPLLYEGFASGSLIKFPNKDCLKKMEEWESRCKLKLNKDLHIHTVVKKGQWHAVMKEIITGKHIDLVIIPQKRKRFGRALIQRMNLNRLSQQAQCPVLTVNRGFNVNHLNNIVVPVDDFLPVKKLSMANYFSREINSNVHLMDNSSDDENGRKYLIKAYHLLNDYGNVKIQCALPGTIQQPMSILDYAKSVGADLIVVNTGKESLLKGWWNKLLGKYLYKQSDIPVLIIAPAAHPVQLVLN
jgi:nucleotide-binding universal stress UspA family protein